jgi:hypothetical protein
MHEHGKGVGNARNWEPGVMWTAALREFAKSTDYTVHDNGDGTFTHTFTSRQGVRP